MYSTVDVRNWTWAFLHAKHVLRAIEISHIVTFLSDIVKLNPCIYDSSHSDCNINIHWCEFDLRILVGTIVIHWYGVTHEALQRSLRRSIKDPVETLKKPTETSISCGCNTYLDVKHTFFHLCKWFMTSHWVNNVPFQFLTCEVWIFHVDFECIVWKRHHSI